MAGGNWWEDSPGLRQVFGAIVNATDEHATTAQVWQAMRDAATDIATRTLGVTSGGDVSEADISAAAGNLLKGITVQQVNSARSAAGNIVSAHNALSQLETDVQIGADAVARPPWAQTVNAHGIKEQYRIRVLRDITVRGFTAIQRQEWATYNLSGPLTTLGDALSQANTLFTGADYNRNVSINQVLDYSIEAV